MIDWIRIAQGVAAIVAALLVTIWDAAAPPQSLAFMFYGAGIVVFPVVLIYTVAVYWIFRGKVMTAWR